MSKPTTIEMGILSSEEKEALEEMKDHLYKIFDHYSKKSKPGYDRAGCEASVQAARGYREIVTTLKNG